jgi:hypothetical protein
MAGLVILNRDWSQVLSNINPFSFGSIGAALALTLCVIGAGW